MINFVQLYVRTNPVHTVENVLQMGLTHWSTHVHVRLATREAPVYQVRFISNFTYPVLGGGGGVKIYEIQMHFVSRCRTDMCLPLVLQ